MKILEDILTAIFAGTGKLLEGVFDIAEALVRGTPRKQEKYDSNFTNVKNVVSARNKGICVDGIRSLTLKTSLSNVIVFGMTGSFKSSSILIPTCFKATESSLIINDPSGEIYEKTSGYLKQLGYIVMVLNFANPWISEGYNPLSHIKKSSDIGKIALLLVQNVLGKNAKDPFWNASSVSLLSCLIGIALEQEEKSKNMSFVIYMLNQIGSNPEVVDALFVRTENEKLYEEYRAIIGYDKKMLSSIIANTKAAVNVFSNEETGAVTSVDTIDFESFRERRTVVYIQNKISDLPFYSPLISLFFQQLFAFIMNRFKREGERDLLLLIDEASSLYLPDTLQIGLSNIRKFSAGCLLCYQSYQQVIDAYQQPAALAIKTNCYTKIQLSGTSMSEAQEIESMMGKHEFETVEGQKRTMPLMSADNIRSLDESKGILICGNRKPAIMKLTPYFMNSTFNRYANIPPPTLSQRIPFNDIPGTDTFKHV